jgi:hypothetical protein
MSSSPKFAIPRWVADIAIKYSVFNGDNHPTVSKGIKIMDKKIKERECD